MPLRAVDENTDVTPADIVRLWLRQILDDPVVMHAIEAGGQVEVRLFTHSGRVRKAPVVLLNSGPTTTA